MKHTGTVQSTACVIYQNRCDTESLRNTRQKVAVTAMRRGCSYAQALALSDTLTDAVRKHHDLFINMQENTNAVIDRFLAQVAAAPNSRRLLLELREGFRLAQDADAMETLCTAKARSEARKAIVDDGISEQQLLNEVREAMESFNVSAEAMENITAQLRLDPLRMAAEAGHDHFTNKCLTALYLYQAHGGDISVEEAAGIASSWQEMQAIEKAMKTGELTKNIATVLISIAILALGIYLFHGVIVNIAVVKGYKFLAYLLALALSTEWLTTKVPEAIGAYSIMLPEKLQTLRGKKHSTEKVVASYGENIHVESAPLLLGPF